MYKLHVVDVRPLRRASHVGADQPVRMAGVLEAKEQIGERHDSDATV